MQVRSLPSPLPADRDSQSASAPKPGDSLVLAAVVRALELPESVIPTLQEAVGLLASKQTKDAERKYAAAESQRASAEHRYAEAEAKIGNLTLEMYKSDVTAKERYLQLLLLKDRVDIREELNIIENKYAGLMTKDKFLTKILYSDGEEKKKNGSDKSSSNRLEIWTYFFGQDGEKNFKSQKPGKDRGEKGVTKQKEGIMSCCRRASRFYNTPKKAAATVERIMANLNSKFHRSHTREEIKAAGGIPLVESDQLARSECHLLKCVFDRERKGARVYTKKAIPRLLVDLDDATKS